MTLATAERTAAKGLLPIGARKLFVAAIGFYCVCLTIAYRWLLVPAYGYWGMDWDSGVPFECYVLLGAAALAPAMILDIRLDRASGAFLLVQYLFIYIPALLLAFHSGYPKLSRDSATELCGILAVSFLAMVLWQRYVPLLELPRIRLSSRAFWFVIACAAAICTVVVFVILRSNLRWVGLSGIYSVRSGADELLDATGSRIGKYAYSWLEASFLPLCFAGCIAGGHKMWGLLVLAVYAPLYGMLGSKAAAIAPLLLIAIAAITRIRTGRLAIYGTLAIAIALLAPALIPDADALGIIRRLAIGVFDFRTVTIQPLQLIQYLVFFSAHPLTYGAQITGIGAIVHYPYEFDVPRTIGSFYYGALMDANAGFWAQDGIASLGWIGIPIASLVCMVTLWLLDSAAKGLKSRFVLIAVGYMLIVFTNTSIFTTLVTSGLVLLAFAFALAPDALRDGNHVHRSLQSAVGTSRAG